jgi:hypothetical protein
MGYASMEKILFRPVFTSQKPIAVLIISLIASHKRVGRGELASIDEIGCGKVPHVGSEGGVRYPRAYGIASQASLATS